MSFLSIARVMRTEGSMVHEGRWTGERGSCERGPYPPVYVGSVMVENKVLHTVLKHVATACRDWKANVECTVLKFSDVLTNPKHNNDDFVCIRTVVKSAGVR